MNESICISPSALTTSAGPATAASSIMSATPFGLANLLPATVSSASSWNTEHASAYEEPSVVAAATISRQNSYNLSDIQSMYELHQMTNSSVYSESLATDSIDLMAATLISPPITPMPSSSDRQYTSKVAKEATSPKPQANLPLIAPAHAVKSHPPLESTAQFDLMLNNHSLQRPFTRQSTNCFTNCLISGNCSPSWTSNSSPHQTFSNDANNLQISNLLTGWNDAQPAQRFQYDGYFDSEENPPLYMSSNSSVPLKYGSSSLVYSFDQNGNLANSSNNASGEMLNRAGTRTGAAPIQSALACDVCGKLFTRTFNLKSHQKTHTQERPYRCRWGGCSKSFARKHDCLRHERIHAAPVSPRRPHLCPAPACTRRFAHERGVEKHLRGNANCAAAVSAANMAAAQEPKQNV